MTEFKTVFFQTYQEAMALADSKLGNIGNLRRGREVYCVEGTAIAALNRTASTFPTFTRHEHTCMSLHNLTGHT
jgi:hypothetical protein